MYSKTTEHLLENVMRQERSPIAIIVGAEKRTRKNKTEGVEFISKKWIKPLPQNPKKVFILISYFEQCFYIQSLPNSNLALV